MHLGQVNAIAVWTLGSAGALSTLGFVIVSVIQCIQKRHSAEESQHSAEESQHSAEESQHSAQGNPRQELAIEEVVIGLHKHIEALQNGIIIFRKLISNPDELLPLPFNRGFKQGTQKEKLDEYWDNICLVRFASDYLMSILKSTGLQQHEAISQKQAELTELMNQLLELRSISYSEFVMSLGDVELLEEAKKYYIKSFLERKKSKETIENMTIQTILPFLKKRVQDQAENTFNIVEMQAIILTIERNMQRGRR